MASIKPIQHLSVHPACLLLLIGLLAAPFFLNGQTYLVIQKNGKMKNIKLKPGDDLMYCVKGDNTFRTEVIGHLADSTITFNNGRKLLLKDIDKVRTQYEIVRILGGLSLIAGAGYLTLDVVNNLINGIGPVFDPQTMLISGVLIGTGIVCYQLRYKTMKMGTHWHLVLVDLQNPPSIK